MPHHLRKMNEVVSRVERARSAATAFRLAGRATDQPVPLFWPDLMQVLETILPTPDELEEAVQCLHCADGTGGCPCRQRQL